MPFEPGQSGNPGGRGKRQWRDAIDRAVKRATTGKVDYVMLDQLADKIVAMAADGDIQALKEIGDRLDGKAVQAIANDDDSTPFIVKIIRPGTSGSAE